MTNSSNDTRSIAFDMGYINRSKDCFELKENLNKCKLARKFHEISYEYKERSQDTEGIMKVRLFSGQGDWGWFDTKKSRNKGVLCQTCCNEFDTPVWHAKPDCPSQGQWQFVNLNFNIGSI